MTKLWSGTMNWLLIKLEKLDKNWLNIFFDNKDASRAYLLPDKLISRKYLWEKVETNWVKKNAGVLKQMQEKIDSL